jgi:uncharacterized protein YcbK (DUF882 family)
MKHKFLKFFLTFCLGSAVAITGLRFAPKISLNNGLALQKKICPVFALQTQKYFKLKDDYASLKKKKAELAGFKEKADELEKQLDAAEKFLKPDITLKGSMESVVYQNYLMEKEMLKKTKTQAGINDLKKKKVLVKLESGDELKFDSKQVKKENRYCLGRVKNFLGDMSEEFYEEFENPIVITSLSRSAEYQKKLRKKNGNASQIFEGSGSAHSAGAAVDIKKRGLSARELKWIRNYLLEQEEAGLVEATEEYIQPNFHVMVLADYKKLD